MKVVEQLLARGADVGATDSAAFTPLHVAVFRGHEATRVDVFRVQGLGVEVRALRVGVFKVQGSGVGVRGSGVGPADSAAFTPLHVAVFRGHEVP